MEYTMEDYHQGNMNSDAMAVLTKLKLELATRESNEHVGSGLGGSPTDFLWMLSHTVLAVGLGDQDAEPYFSRVGKEEIVFYTPKKPSMKAVRAALTKFLDENYPARQVVTQGELINPSFLRDLNSNALEVQLLTQALEHTHELAKWLDLKYEAQRQLEVLEGKEIVALERCFLEERGLPASYFEDHKKEKGNPMRRMLNKHPVWGTKIKAVSERYHGMIEQLLSPEDNQKLKMIGSYPSHITLYAFRSAIGIERIVYLNLDENSSCDFLLDINKESER